MSSSTALAVPPRRRGGGSLYFTAGILISAVFVLPLAWEILRSFQPASAIISPPSLKSFSHLGLGNYRQLLTGQDDILRNVVNSLIVAFATSLLTSIVATLAGYGFGRFRFRGSGIAFAVVLVGFMVPFQAVLTPLFLEMHYLHLLNSLIGLALFYTAFNLPFGIYVMRNTFLQVPGELVDAAKVDGASTMSTLTRVLRAIVMPGIATTFLYAFLFAWTEFLGALTFVTSGTTYTLPVALSNVETNTYGAVNYGYLVAGAVIAMIPCILVYVALQRYYVRGLVSGAVKG
ncbi:MAG: carbohydrate ABC transporter permease [Actinomycetota bacterium]|jgi:multiple sugar transport system permease protein|nr:carbohydrate ABC transporter permease [Actinomycetota bacterium]